MAEIFWSRIIRNKQQQEESDYSEIIAILEYSRTSEVNVHKCCQRSYWNAPHRSFVPKFFHALLFAVFLSLLFVCNNTPPLFAPLYNFEQVAATDAGWQCDVGSNSATTIFILLITGTFFLTQFSKRSCFRFGNSLREPGTKEEFLFVIFRRMSPA